MSAKKKKFFKTTFTIVVLSEEKPYECGTVDFTQGEYLSSIGEDIDAGPVIGSLVENGSEEVVDIQAELRAIGNDGSFFDDPDESDEANEVFKVIRCADCNDTFGFTVADKQFYESQNPPLEPPTRCRLCRKALEEKQIG